MVSDRLFAGDLAPIFDALVRPPDLRLQRRQWCSHRHSQPLALHSRLLRTVKMGVQKKTRKFATVKRMIGQRDARLKKNIVKNEERNQQKKKTGKGDDLVREVYAFSDLSNNPYNQPGANHSLINAAHEHPQTCSSNTTPPSNHPTKSSSTPTFSHTQSTTNCHSSRLSWTHFMQPVHRSSPAA